MSTIGNQLNILRDTQMVQRRRLEKMFPYIEWDRMPFSSYNDFFRLRGIIDDCGAVWTNAYGRSNEEPDGQRNFLEDYSGNGRDIELFNFGYSKQSGFNGYVQDFRVWSNGQEATLLHQTENSITVKNNNTSAARYVLSISSTIYTDNEWKVIVEADEDADVAINYLDGAGSSIKYQLLHNGLNVINISELSFNSVVIAANAGKTITLTQIALYPGAIVGDGIDDYGQCVKDFALPDDYTVVAMRENSFNSPNPLISKSIYNGDQAFVFEDGDTCYSYGGALKRTSFPELFSYMTKTSYNGIDITPGSRTDSESVKLYIFSEQGKNAYKACALYSFGIFTRTLTDEELRIVENCMYAEWICMTGKLEDIEYYDILDARFRSNEEDADKRNRWVGRLGKLHMTLNNYAYSQMSGWNGTRYNFVSVGNISTVIGNKITITHAYSGINTYSVNPPIVDNILSLKAKFTGIDRLMQSGEITGVYLIASDSSGETLKFGTHATKDGIIELSVDVNGVEGVARASLYVALKNTQEATLIPLSSPITIDVFPDYGGALVSDGVDDYAVSDEVIDEPIGGVVVHGETIRNGTEYFFNSGTGDSDGISRRYAYHFSDRKIYLGAPNTAMDINLHNIYSLNMEANIPNTKIFIQSSGENTEFGQNALYQLRLIKTQPTDVQLEAIKWQCRKEHDDYLIHMGWKEVE